MVRFHFGAIVAGLLLASSLSPASAQPADTVLFNVKVLTVD